VLLAFIYNLSLINGLILVLSKVYSLNDQKQKLFFSELPHNDHDLRVTIITIK